MAGGRTDVAIDGPNGQRGFTLLESMLASVILSVGLLGMAAIQGMAMVRNVDANELTRITTLASDIMERIQYNRRNASAYNGINTATSGTCNAITQVQAKGDCLLWDSLVDGTQFQDIQGTVTVSDVIAPTVLGQRTVRVTLTWMGSMNSSSSVKRSRSVTFDRVVAPE